MKSPRSNKFLFIAVILGLLIIGGAVFYAQKQGAAPNVNTGPAKENVALEDTFSKCAQGDSCIVVDTTCSFCCNYVAINATFEKAFDATFQKQCSRYEGEHCECFDLSSYPACIEGRCQLVEWPENR